jgi:hypothetical protein
VEERTRSRKRDRSRALVHEPERVRGGMRGQLGGLTDADHLRRMSPPLELRRHIERDGTTLSLPIDADEAEPERGQRDVPRRRGGNGRLVDIRARQDDADLSAGTP